MLTKKEALEKTVHMWRWIAEECEKRKRAISKKEYFEYHNISDIPLSRCYLCEYQYQFKVHTCLIKKWNLEDDDCLGGGCCCGDYEFGDYRDGFYDNDYKKCIKAANTIADLAEMELKKLEKEADIKNTLLK